MTAEREIAVYQPGGFTPRRWTVFLSELKKGQTVRAACAKAGFARSTLYKWLSDPSNMDLVEQIEHAKDEGERRLVEAVTNAAHTGETITTPGGTVKVMPGDWRAAAWLLEHHPQTRERYAAISKQQIGGDPDNPSPVKVDMPVVGDLSQIERNAAIVTLLQRQGILPIPGPDDHIIDVTPEEHDAEG